MAMLLSNLWGTGSPMREFLHVDDLAKAVLFGLENSLREHLYNIGTGEDLKIKDLALLVQSLIGHKGEICWDVSKPDGTPRKLLDVSKMNSLKWKSTISIDQGIKSVYKSFLESRS